MKNRHYYLIILMIWSFQSKILAQSTTLEINGTVRSMVDKQALDFAHVAILGKGLGTLTNRDGIFRLLVSDEALEDTLVISYLGYETLYKLVKTIKSEGEDFLLEKQSIELQEVVVKPKNPLDLIEQAIERIPENFAGPHIKRGFYRLVSTRDSSFLHLSEAVFDIYLPGYGAKKGRDLFRLIKKRAVKDVLASHDIDLGMKPHLIYEYDIVSDVKDSKLLSKRALKNYEFEWKGLQPINGQTAHKIYFNQKEGLKKSLYEGYIYLEETSLAIIHINFSMSSRGAQYAQFGSAALRALLSLSGLKITVEKEDFQVFYQKYGDKWYLSHCINDVVLDFSNQKEHYNYKADIRTAYLVSEIDTTEVEPFVGTERLAYDAFIEKLPYTYETNSWDDYTIILSDYSFDEIEADIQARNAKNLENAEEGYLGRRPKEKELREIILKEHNQGATVEELAEKTGKSVQEVQEIIDSEGK